MEAPVYKEVTKCTCKGYELAIDHSGNKFYYLNGEFHREGGPAIVYADGSKEWYQNGWRHREDGPAYEYANRNNYWCLNGTDVSEEAFKEVWNCPLGKLPLYTNTIFAPIAKRRLSNPKEVLNG